MVTTAATIRKYFAKLGLEAEIADIYLALHSHGPQNISELSRNARVERTRIYRLIDKLLQTNLIELEAQSKRGIIKAAPIANLHILIREREQELKSLQDELELIEQALARNSLSNPAVRVQMYQGPQGIRQLLWNMLHTKSDITGYSNRTFEAIIGKKEAENWSAAFKKQQLKARLFVDNHVLQEQQSVQVIKGMAYHPAPGQFAVTHTCFIYNDVVASIYQKDGELFGLEIYNRQLADTQRQLLDLLWAQLRYTELDSASNQRSSEPRAQSPKRTDSSL